MVKSNPDTMVDLHCEGIQHLDPMQKSLEKVSFSKLKLYNIDLHVVNTDHFSDAVGDDVEKGGLGLYQGEFSVSLKCKSNQHMVVAVNVRANASPSVSFGVNFNLHAVGGEKLTVHVENESQLKHITYCDIDGCCYYFIQYNNNYVPVFYHATSDIHKK